MGDINDIMPQPGNIDDIMPQKPSNGIPPAIVTPKEPSIGDKFKMALDSFNSQMYADTQAALTGAARVGATIAKSVSKAKSAVGLDPVVSPEQFQNLYEQQQQKSDAAARGHVGTMPFDIAGSIGMGALVGMPSGLATGAYNAVGGGIKGVLAASAGGAAQNALFGGSLTQPGQGGDIINKAGAIGGGIIGAFLGPVEAKVSNWLTGSAELDKAKSNVNIKVNDQPVEFKGELKNQSDGGNGMLATIRNKIVKAVTGLDPEKISNALGGSEEDTLTSNPAYAPYLQDYVNAISKNSEGAPEQVIKQQLNKTNQTLLSEAARAHNDFRQGLVDAGIDKIPVDNTQNAVSEILKDPTGIPKALLTKLQTMDDAGVTKLSPDALLKLKQDIGFIQNSLKTASKLSPDSAVAYRATSQLYGAISDDLKAAVADSPELTQQLTEANALTQAQKSFTNLKENPLIAKAIKSSADQMIAVKRLINTTIGNSATPQQVQGVLGAVGEPGARALEQIKMTKIINDSIDSNGNLNVNAFLDAMNPAKNPNLPNIIPESLNYLKGLRNVILQNNGAQPAAMIGLEDLGKIGNSSAMKSLLETINRATDAKAGTEQYLLNSVNKLGSKLGISALMRPNAPTTTAPTNNNVPEDLK